MELVNRFPSLLFLKVEPLFPKFGSTNIGVLLKEIFNINYQEFPPVAVSHSAGVVYSTQNWGKKLPKPFYKPPLVKSESNSRATVVFKRKIKGGWKRVSSGVEKNEEGGYEKTVV